MTSHFKLFERFLALSLAALISMAPLVGCSSGAAVDNAPREEARTSHSMVDGGDGADGSAQEPIDLPQPFGALDLDQVPEFSGSPYVVIAGDRPGFTEDDYDAPSESYSPLDSLGRCGVAMAMVSRDTMPTEERGSIGMVKPSGWHTVRYDDLVDGRYLYNRCHLLGYQLTGENANTSNLITGTRFLNVEGMLPFENQIADYVERTGNRVLYRVTPVFEGDDLVARGVHMEARSLEDGGAGVSFNVFCYNVQPGVAIDYATGESWRDEPSAPTSVQEGTRVTYIANVNTDKFHLPDCGSVSRMKDWNKKEITATRDEMIAWGYTPCANCNP